MTHTTTNEPFWGRLYVHQIDEVWAAMIMADNVIPPAPPELIRLGVLMDSDDGAKRDNMKSEPRRRGTAGKARAILRTR